MEIEIGEYVSYRDGRFKVMKILGDGNMELLIKTQMGPKGPVQETKIVSASEVSTRGSEYLGIPTARGKSIRRRKKPDSDAFIFRR
ncbi:MAG: hypothetical protein ABI430_04915 [Candidatus Taylorbacteria bacterium]